VEIDRLVNALASIDQKPEAVIQGIAERQDRLSALEARLKAAKAAPSALDLEVRRMEKEVRQRLGDLRAMLERNPDEGRKALKTILGGPLRFTPIETPDGKRYTIEGVIALETVVAVESNQPRALQAASPAGHDRKGNPAAPRKWGFPWRSPWSHNDNAAIDVTRSARRGHHQLGGVRPRSWPDAVA
jgi:hypothetical protein